MKTKLLTKHYTQKIMAYMTKERNRDFAAQCRRIKRQAMKNGETLTEAQVVELAIESPAPGYYVDYDYALTRFYRKQAKESKRELKRKMWGELRRKVEREMEERDACVADALHSVLAFQPASRFFIDKIQGQRLYAKMKRSRPRRPRARLGESV